MGSLLYARAVRGRDRPRDSAWTFFVVVVTAPGGSLAHGAEFVPRIRRRGRGWELFHQFGEGQFFQPILEFLQAGDVGFAALGGLGRA